MSPRARQAKGKARVKAYNQLLDSSGDVAEKELEIYIPPGPRLGDLVIRAESAAKSYDDLLLFEEMTFDIPAGATVGVVGPNGAGKTTLLRIIIGQESTESGQISVGQSVELGHVDQSRDSLDPDNSIWEEISGGADHLQLGQYKVNSRAYVARFNFTGSDQQQKVGSLSGGERNRVHLAKMLKSGANVLLLDEPTNDLDVNTLRALEDALLNFGGCSVIVSHDRWFLDRVATHILAFEGESAVFWFPGNYSDYEADRRQRLGPAADRPHRITYRKFRRD
jgi:ATPase subunit of ABC transporter with duplicated ATPase domains